MQTGGSSSRPVRTEREQTRDAVVTVLLVAVFTVVYYLVPVPGGIRGASWAVLFCAGVVMLAALIVLGVGRLLRAGPNVRVRSLVLLMCVAVLFFSWSDVVLAKEPGQFADLHTKTDALYFSISTLATVGFGDVHASGQLARVAVILQILFNLVFLGVVIAVLTGWMRSRATHRMHQQRGAPGDSTPGGPAS